MNTPAAMINQALSSMELKSVCVKNLPRDMPDLHAILRNIFESYGAVRDVYIPMDRYTGLPIGFGFIEFLDPADAIKAVASLYRGVFLGGKRVRVAMAEGGRKQPEEMSVRIPTVPLTDRLYAATMERVAGFAS